MTGKSFRHLRVLKLIITYLIPEIGVYTWLDSETTLYVLLPSSPIYIPPPESFTISSSFLPFHHENADALAKIDNAPLKLSPEAHNHKISKGGLVCKHP
jgi:hypothetical protein